MMLECKYSRGEYIYLKTDVEQQKRMVIEILFGGAGVQYRLACGSATSWHHEIECTKKKNVLKKIIS